MSDTPIRLARPDVGEAELAAVAEVLASGQLTMGPQVEAFERALARAVGTAEAVAVSSGTAAIHLALLALGIGPGDEVIVPAYTFPATANAVELCGARAVLVDVDPETFLVRPELVADAVTSRTRAVLAVHLFGRPRCLGGAPDRRAAGRRPGRGRRRRARGGAIAGRLAAALGLLACLSFHPRKIVTTGEGGAVTTDEAELAAAVRRLRHHGIAAGHPTDIETPGFNYRLADVLCALGLPQLERLESAPRRARARRRLVRRAARAPRRRRRRPTRATGTAGRRTSSRSTGATRRSTALRAEGIEAQIGTYAFHRLSAYRDRGSFPGADAAFERALALPVRQHDDRGRRSTGSAPHWHGTPEPFSLRRGVSACGRRPALPAARPDERNGSPP